MAVNTAKIKFVIFWTMENRIDPNDCRLVSNSEECGKTEDPNPILYISREEKSFPPQLHTCAGVPAIFHVLHFPPFRISVPL
jgi:hypothetical protein